jgi:putative peptide zinc metalloprotease protein
VATVAGITTLLFNLNPLGRMDGYYVLGDLLERPNLMGQAMAAAQAALARVFAVNDGARTVPFDWPMLAYWAGGFGFRMIVFIGMAWLAHGVAPWLGLIVAMIGVSLLFIRPPLAAARTLLTSAEDRPAMRRKLLITGGIAVGLLVLLPLPAGVATVGVVERPGATLLFAPRDARVGAVAAAGVMAAGATPLLLEATEADADVAAMAARRAAALIDWRRQSDAGAASAQAAAEIVTRIDAQTAALAAESARLAWQSAHTARFDPLDSADYTGSYVAIARGRPLALIDRGGAARLHLLLPEDQAGAVEQGQRLRARLAGLPGDFGATITRVAPVADSRLPSAALGREAGGPIETVPGELRSAHAAFISVWAAPDADAPALLLGQRIDARIGLPPRPLVWQAIVAARRLADDRAQRN